MTFFPHSEVPSSFIELKVNLSGIHYEAVGGRDED